MASDVGHRSASSLSIEGRGLLYAALDSFRQYRQAAHYNVTHLRRQAFYSLPSDQAALLSEPPFSLPQTLRDVDDAIDANADIAEAILEAGLQSYGISPEDHSWHGKARASDVDKARSTIRQLYRDWSSEGATERQASFSHIEAGLKKNMPLHQAPTRVLVPGAGLGRLVFDLSTDGYHVEGNELSYHQILASSYILHCTDRTGQHSLYPWTLSFSNHTSRANQLRSVGVPDICPQTATVDAQHTARESGSASWTDRIWMRNGDFCVLYKQPRAEATYDAVTTCFFIDTAPTLISYINTVRHCLKPGGLWLNLGPLLWHFEVAPTPAQQERSRQHTHASSEAAGDHAEHDHASMSDPSRGIGEPGSVELSNDEVIALVQRLGFEIIEHVERVESPAGYITDAESMMSTYYRPAFWVAKKL